MPLVHKSKVRQRFSKAAEQYDALAQMQRDIANELMALLPTICHHSKRALDLGCGTGYAMNRLHEVCPQANLHGVDLAWDMLHVARSIRTNQAPPDTQYIQADIENLPYAEQSFDLVFSSSSLQWCDMTNAVNEMIRVAQPGACLAFSTFAQGTLQDWRALWQLEKAPVFFMQVSEIKEIGEVAGLQDIMIKHQIKQQRFCSFDDAVNSIRQLGAGHSGGAYLGLMGKQRYRLIKKQIEQTIEQQGHIILPYHVVYVTAIAT